MIDRDHEAAPEAAAAMSAPAAGDADGADGAPDARPDSGGIIEIRSSRSRLAIFGVASGAMAVLGAWVLFRYQPVIPGRSLIAANLGVSLAIVFFAGGAIVLLVLAARPMTVVTITDDGIVMHGKLPGGTVALLWSEIVDVEEFTYSHSRMLGFRTEDDDAVLTEMPLWAAVLGRLSRRLCGYVFAIPANLVGSRWRMLVDLIVDRVEAAGHEAVAPETAAGSED